MLLLIASAALGAIFGGIVTIVNYLLLLAALGFALDAGIVAMIVHS
jgi:hypothetical protein